MAAGYTVRVDQFEIRVQSIEAGRRLVTKVVREIKDGAEAILSFGPYTNGRLKRGLETRISYGPYIVEGRVGISGVRYPYAASVEGGAKAHRIPLVPKGPNSWLVFYWRKVGRVVAFKQVKHPGQTGKAYLRIPLLVVAPKYNMRVFTYD
jgi:hypothetical protein